MRRRWILVGIVLVLLAAAGLGGWAALAQGPEFYAQQLALKPEAQVAASTEMFNRAQRLAHQTRKPGQWQAQFTAQQINGYLAVDLVKDFPEAATPQIRDPRIQLRDGQATLAFRYTGGPIASVVSLVVDAYLIEPNVVALRVRSAKAGALPLPLTDMLEAISTAAAAADIPLRWRQTDGDPVALVTLAPRPGHPPLAIDRLEIRESGITVAGHTASSATAQSKPALHR